MKRWQYERLVAVVRPDATRWGNGTGRYEVGWHGACSGRSCYLPPWTSLTHTDAHLHTLMPPNQTTNQPIFHNSIADIVDQYGLGDGRQWMDNWEAAWRTNLDACGPGPDGECSIH